MSFYYVITKHMEGILMGEKIAIKVLQCDFYWTTLFRDAFKYWTSYPRCQLSGRSSKRDMMALNPIIVVETFYVLGRDFMGQFLSSFENEYILLAIDNVSKR